MSIWLRRALKKPSGGKLKKFRQKRKRELGRTQSLTSIGESKVRKIRTMGGNLKFKALTINSVNVYDPKKKINVKAEVQDVMLNPANRHYVRMDVITKGAVLKTNLGFVRVTNRPGQEGFANGVFTDYSEEKGGTRISKTAAKKKVKKHADKKEPKIKVKKESLAAKVKKVILDKKEVKG